MRRIALTLMVFAFATACMDGEQPTAPLTETASSSLATTQLEDVIVVFRDDVADPRGLALGLVNGSGGSLGHVYESALRGFSASLPPQTIEGIRNNPNVAYVEWTQEKIEPSLRSEIPESVYTDDAKMRPLITSYDLEFYELVTPGKLGDRGFS